MVRTPPPGNALRWVARAGASWRTLPTNFPPWELLYRQTQHWLNAGCFEAMASDLRSVLRVAQQRQGQPSLVILALSRQGVMQNSASGFETTTMATTGKTPRKTLPLRIAKVLATALSGGRDPAQCAAVRGLLDKPSQSRSDDG